MSHHTAPQGIEIADSEGSRFRLSRESEQYLLTVERREGDTPRTFQAHLSAEQFSALARFNDGTAVDSAPLEIERKWLVCPSSVHHGLAAVRAEGTSVSIEQGYLVLGDSEARLRRKEGAHILTLKGSGGRSRCEVEIELSPEQFAALWPATEGRRLEKTRTSFPLPQPTAEPVVVEVDEFHGAHAPLVVVECEFPSETAADSFVPPGWFGVEVTEDGSYKNKSLVRNGVPLSTLSALRPPTSY
jgi:adenylate cyclase